MKIKEVLDKLDYMPDKEEIAFIKNEAEQTCKDIDKEIKKQKIKAETFIGGSLAKSTLVKKDKYDVDIFVRFDWQYENLSEKLEKILLSVAKRKKANIDKIHGSRDYFRLEKNNLIFEIIPVLKITKPKEARNVTDLSYFHVNYVKKRVNNDLAREIILAKAFCKAHGVYGAESYIQGFSGYGLECLSIYYGGFEKMLRALVKVKEREIIDPEKKYKIKDSVLLEINESKLQSPIVLIDPTWKERNVLAALSRESFHKFQNAAIIFLKNPGISFFEEKKIDEKKMKEKAKKRKADFSCVFLKTDKQTGDIAGTKLKKFVNFLTREIESFYFILDKEFLYDEEQSANFYICAKSKKEIDKIGPPESMKEACTSFKKKNRNIFVKNGLLHSKIKIGFSLPKFLIDFKRKILRKLREMGITGMKILK